MVAVHSEIVIGAGVAGLACRGGLFAAPGGRSCWRKSRRRRPLRDSASRRQPSTTALLFFIGSGPAVPRRASLGGRATPTRLALPGARNRRAGATDAHRPGEPTVGLAQGLTAFPKANGGGAVRIRLETRVPLCSPRWACYAVTTDGPNLEARLGRPARSPSRQSRALSNARGSVRHLEAARRFWRSYIGSQPSLAVIVGTRAARRAALDIAYPEDSSCCGAVPDDSASEQKRDSWPWSAGHARWSSQRLGVDAAEWGARS